MRRLTIFNGLLLSLCFHILLVAIVLVHNLIEPKALPDNTVAIDFVETPMTPNQNNSKIRPPVLSAKNQVVEQAEKPSNNEVPTDSRFLSAYNQKVEKQTIAAERGEFKNVAKPSDDNKARKIKGTSETEKVARQSKSKPTLQDLSPEFDPLAIKERQQKAEDSTGGRDFENADGGDLSRSNDYIKDVNRGNETLLNSREFKYYTYYARIRRQLSQHWEPKVKVKLSKLFKTGRNIASNQDHITKLLIILNEKGVLVKVQVLSASGVRDLDDAAMEAFHSAAPFPNPPRGIVETDGTIKIRWDFVLES